MRDDDRILRDVEKTSEQTLREGRMAIQERELGLVKLSGEPSIVAAAREARYRIMEELFAGEEPLLFRSDGIAYARPLDLMHGHLLSVLKRKNAAFWFQHRDSIPEEAVLSERFELKPIAGDSPLAADARSARIRLLWSLLHLRLIGVNKVAFAFDETALRNAEVDRMMEAQNKNLEVVQMAGHVLSQKSAQFWYEHKDFEVEELIKLHFPDIQNWMTPSERDSYQSKGGMFLMGAAFFFFFGLTLREISFIMWTMFTVAVGMLVAALVKFSLAKGNPYGNDMTENPEE